MPRLLAIAVVTALVLSASSASAYPISPRTLWELTDEADLVVLAKVVDLGEVDGDEDSWSRDVAKLSVADVIKGPSGSRGAPSDDVKAVEVRFAAGMMCPAPARYVNGEHVLAFLAGPDDDGRYSTVGLSYGTLYPEVDELDVFIERIRAAVKLQSAPVRSDVDERWWRVKTAAQAATRWHGAYRLVPELDRIHSFYDRSDARISTASLTPRELRILAAGFVEEPSVDHTLPMMLTLLAGTPRDDVDAAAVAAIDHLAAVERPPYWTGDAIALTLDRLGRPIAARVEASPEQTADPLVHGVAGSTEALLVKWREVRPTLEVEARHVEVRRPRVRGVGPATPP